MCPHAELLLGDADRASTSRRRRRRSRPRSARRRCAGSELVLALGAVPRIVPVPGLAEHGALVQVARRTRSTCATTCCSELEAADAAQDEAAAARAALVRLRRRGLRGRRGARRALRPRRRRDALLPAAARRAAALGARRRGAEDPAGDPAAARASTPRASSSERGVEIHVGTTLESVTADEAVLGDGTRDPDAHARLDGRRARRTRCCASSALPLDERGARRGRRVPARARARERLGARRLRARARTRAATTPDPPTCQHALRQARRLAKNLAGRPAAVRLPDARPGRDARPLQGHRRRARHAPPRLPRLVRHPELPPVPAAARAAPNCASSSTGRCRSSSGATSPSSARSATRSVSTRTSDRRASGYPPRTFQRDVAPGIHRIEDAFTNWYLVEADGALTR